MERLAKLRKISHILSKKKNSADVFRLVSIIALKRKPKDNEVRILYQNTDIREFVSLWCNIDLKDIVISDEMIHRFAEGNVSEEESLIIKILSKLHLRFLKKIEEIIYLYESLDSILQAQNGEIL